MHQVRRETEYPEYPEEFGGVGGLEGEGGLPLGIPAGQLPDRAKSHSSRALARVMDELVSVPGTKVKFGLDPVLGLFSALGIPVGDAAVNLVSSISLVEAIRRGLPFRSTLKILGNIMVNAAAGSIPVAGDFFSVFFRSNSRNRDVIENYLASATGYGKKPSWFRVVGSVLALILTMALAIGVTVAIYIYVGSQVWHYLGTGVRTIFQ